MIHAYKIPHSVAGATLMAVGASTPELLASFIGVFIAAESGEQANAQLPARSRKNEISVRRADLGHAIH